MSDHERKSGKVQKPMLGGGLTSLLSSANKETSTAPTDRMLVDHTLLDPNPFQHRTTMDEGKVKELMGSIAKVGTLLQEIWIRPHPTEPGRNQIIFGHRRTESYRRLYAQATDEATKEKYAKIPARMKADATDEDMFTLSLMENMDREDPSHLDIALGLAAYQKRFALDTKTAAEKLGYKETTLRRYFALAEAPDFIQSALQGVMVEVPEEDGTTKKQKRVLDFLAAQEFIRFWNNMLKSTKPVYTKEKAEDRIRKNLDRALSEGWGVRRVAEEVKALIEGRKPKAEPAKETASASPFQVKKTEKKWAFSFDLAQLDKASDEHVQELATHLQAALAEVQLAAERVAKAKKEAPSEGSEGAPGGQTPALA